MKRQYYVYIMASYRGTLYVGVTNDLCRRVHEHQEGLGDGFTKRYKIRKLVYYEATEEVMSAIERERQIKGWTRARKAALIEAVNPYWKDLAKEWEAPLPMPPRPFGRGRPQGDTGSAPLQS